MYSRPDAFSVKSLATTAMVSGYVAVNLIFSLLNDFSVVIGTESVPTFLPFTYNSNQLSAQTSA
jgi:hypothetical protein